MRTLTAPAPAFAAVAVVLLLGGCAAPGGLAAGEPAPAVSAQPRPEELWPEWTEPSPDAPGAQVGTRVPPPQPLKNGPVVPAGGLAALDPAEVLAADKQMKAFAARGTLDGPGRAGLRPVVLRDLTGDGRPELLVAADLESGRTVLAVYTESGGRVVRILLTTGNRMAVETLGKDLLVRTAANDGAEQAVRYRWDGLRLIVVSDEKRFRRTPPPPGTGGDEARGADHRAAPGAPDPDPESSTDPSAHPSADPPVRPSADPAPGSTRSPAPSALAPGADR
ncbi:hypothetical protein [Streptomyces sp. NPDC097619]|uniref:hypothetical protein n=1 Tax=Streptomyces sp. NPDC097619 TaxID=3157228 RepID=UPI00332B8F62